MAPYHSGRHNVTIPRLDFIPLVPVHCRAVGPEAEVQHNYLDRVLQSQSFNE